MIIVDEFDAVGRRCGSGNEAGHDEREQTLNQLPVCLNEFEKDERSVLIAVTNCSDILDSDLLRPLYRSACIVQRSSTNDVANPYPKQTNYCECVTRGLNGTIERIHRSALENSKGQAFATIKRSGIPTSS